MCYCHEITTVKLVPIEDVTSKEVSSVPNILSLDAAVILAPPVIPVSRELEKKPLVTYNISAFTFRFTEF